VPIGKTGRIRSANKEISLIFFIHHTLPVSGTRIAAPVVLAQHKGHERIGEARKPIRCTSHIAPKIAY
jgi:hypothetical protein